MTIYLTCAEDSTGQTTFLDCTETWGSLACGTQVIYKNYNGRPTLGRVVMYPTKIETYCGNNTTTDIDFLLKTMGIPFLPTVEKCNKNHQYSEKFCQDFVESTARYMKRCQDDWSLAYQDGKFIVSFERSK